MTASEKPTRNRLDRELIGVAGVIILGSFISVLDGTVMNVALPSIQQWFHLADGSLLDYATVAWSILGYTLAQAVVIPLTDWLAKRFGQRRVYLTAIALFTLASIACALSPSIEILILMRILQGLGGGCLMPLGTAILARAAGPERVGRIMAFMGVPMMLGPVLGPILGGWLLHIASWHWIFLINVPFGVLGVIAGLRSLPEDDALGVATFDLPSLLLMSPGLALSVWAISREGSAAEFSIAALIALFIGLSLIALFVLRARRIATPMLDLDVFRYVSFRRCILLMTTFQIGFFGILLMLPAYLQQVQGFEPLIVGLLLVPSGLGSMMTMPFASILIDRMPAGRVIPWGMILIFASTVPLTLLTTRTPWWWLIILQFTLGLGLGIVMMPTSSAALKEVPHQQVGAATTLYSIIGQVSSVTGVAGVSVLIARGMSSHPAASAAIVGSIEGAELVEGLHQAGEVFTSTATFPVVVIACGLLISFFLPRHPSGAPAVEARVDERTSGRVEKHSSNKSDCNDHEGE